MSLQVLLTACVTVQGLYHGVPPVIIPLFVEQPMNAAQAAMLGVGQDVTVPFPIKAPVLAPKLSKALQEVLDTDTFHRAAARTSRLMRARRWTPAEEAASTPLLCMLQSPVCHEV